MTHFQVTAEFGNGATAVFGVEAPDTPGALLLARQRLEWFPQPAEQVRAELVPGCQDR